MLLFWILQFSWIYYVTTEYAGPLCVSQNVPSSYSAGSSSISSSGGKSFMIQDEHYQFTCCGVVNQWNVNTNSGGELTIQIWRHTATSTYTLISQHAYAVVPGDQLINTDEHNKVSVREGDMIGWYSATADLVKYSTSSIQNSRYSTTRVGTNSGDTHDWNTENVVNDAKYSIQAITTATSNPYFVNLPWYTLKADTEVAVGSISLLTLTAQDPDLYDNSSLTISMAPGWEDFFTLDSSNLVTTSRQLTPGTYMPVFRAEEAHCGVGFSAALTVSVYDSMPSITNLPASTTIHEDLVDQTLLYTVSTSDPMNQAIWCEGDWTIGTPSNTPFIVKMISIVPGSSTAGIYLIEWPYLNYDTAAQTYELIVKCYDTYENTATGTFSVNIIRNQEPIFSNMGNMVEINATSSKIGDTVFTVSATDADGDQILYDYTCSPSTTSDGDCPFAVYDTGAVKLKANVITWDTNKFTLSITAKANNDTITAKDLIIYITNQNTLPTFTNINGVTKNVAENSALGASILQVTATDADSDPITYFYDIIPDSGYALFYCTSTGLVQTHSTFNINFDILNPTTYTMRIYAHDTKEMVSDTLTLTVTNVNEAVTFNQPSYGITMEEESATAVPTYIAVTDPDASDTATYVLNCGTYNSYFTLNTPALTVVFAQTYDVDPGLLPDEVPCAVYVTDSGGFNDTTTLFIKISYKNDNSPVFTNGASYTVSLGTDTPVGYHVVSAVATDADRESDTIVNYSLNEGSLPAGTLHIQSGHVIAKTSFAALSVGSYTVLISATDGTNTATATLTLVITLVTTPDPDTSNRYYNFFDDTRNIMWFAAACIAILGLLFVVVVMIIVGCKNRKGPLFKELRLRIKQCFTFEQKPQHQMDRRRRKKPIYGRQHSPQYKHLHARELLRASPDGLSLDNQSMRAESSMSAKYGKVRVSQVNLRAKVNENDVDNWVNQSASLLSTNGTRPKSTNMGSAEPAKRRRRHASRITPDMSLPGTPSITLPLPSTGRLTSAYGEDNQTYIDDDDDFKSERLSIAASRNSNIDDI